MKRIRLRSHGLEHGKAFDPVRLKPDLTYYRSDGSRDAYWNNDRVGFRAGYDAGYRDDTGRRR